MGDRALAHFARVLVGCVRKSDLAARYGGEEFAVLVTGADAAQAAALAERIRVCLAEQPCRIDDMFLPLTISIGVAERNARAGTPEAVIQAADKALYRAKHKGRNQVSQ